MLYSNSRLIAAIGLEDIIVIETKDSVLVCRKDDSQKVKDMVGMLDRKNRSVTK